MKSEFLFGDMKCQVEESTDSIKFYQVEGDQKTLLFEAKPESILGASLEIVAVMRLSLLAIIEMTRWPIPQSSKEIN